ncbi:hypothetical protein [Alkalicoccobacillus plakortidis]|uniref:Uncharacterized protein n=1 Tax=Alkalicoccobacillus plakortidis TaxID=444060 RepID=A0ABT0XQ56_9BACI|nr:hypothetical protein [Alkalicoccobacillus plakortidis]MCM2677397.1 hypothetical protein [Alkalicoccobacillus plakortidis]
MKSIVSINKGQLLLTSFVLIIASLFYNTSFADALTNEEEEFETETPEVQFVPEIIDQYEDEDGNLITEYSELPDEYTTDANGNLITEDTMSIFNACAKTYSFKDKSNTRIKTDKFIANHPDFKKWDKVDGYWFSNKSKSYSVGLSGYGASVSVSVSGPGSGTFIKATSSKWSRPGIYGNVNKIVQEVTVRNPCGPNDKYDRTVYRTNNTYNKTVYK